MVNLVLRAAVPADVDAITAIYLRLHRACGFQFAGTLHAIGYKHGRWLDGVLMQRALGEGDATAPGPIGG
jgi:hypothetical protein